MAKEKKTDGIGIQGVTFEHEGQRGQCTHDFHNNWMVDLACFTRLESVAKESGNKDALDLLKVVYRMLDL